MSKPTRTFTANEGQPSVGTAGPDQIEHDLDNLFAKLNPQALLRDGSPGGIQEENIQPGAATDTIIGDRTIDDTAAPASDTGRLTTLLSGLANRVKALTGKLSWRDTPALTIEQIASTVGPTGLRDGKATDAAIGNRTVSAASAPTGDTGTLSQILGWLANRLTAITGKASWRDTPTINLETVSQYMDTAGLKPGTATDTAIGQRTVDQATAPGSNTGTLSAILGWVANRIAAITGQTDWKTNPPLTLQDVSNTLDATGLKAGKATDTAIGTRTVSDATAPTVDTGTLTQIVGWLANRLKAITGKTGWKDAPAITLEQVAQTVTPSGLAAGKATDAAIGNRTVDQTQLPSSDTGTLTQILGRLANRIQAILGSANWKDAPATTLAAAKAHMDAAAPHSGHETPAGAQAKVDTHAAQTANVHGVDASGVASKSYVDSAVGVHANRTDNPHQVTAAQTGALVGVNNVQNPGGSVNLVAGTGIAITADSNAKTVTITATGEAASIPTAHAFTHATGGDDPLTPGMIGAETPSGAQAKVDAHANLTSAHGATSAATANRIIIRDSAGRAKVASPAAADDIARKAEVDAHANRTDNPHQTTAAQVGAVAKTGDTMTGDLGVGANAEGPAIASIFTGVNTRKSRLDFPAPSGSTLLAYLLRELATLAGYEGKGVVHVIIGSVNSDDLYLAIHGDGQVETLKLFTSGRIETPSSVRADQGFFVGENQVFHPGNDGQGSGLDADFVRGRNLAGELDIHGGAATGVHGVGGYRVAKTSRTDQFPSWADIPDKPATFPPSSHTHDDRYFTEAELSTSGGGGAVHWNNVTNKPSAFAPAAHKSTHAAGGSDPLTPADIGALSINGGDVNGVLNLNTLNGRAVAPVGADKWAVV